MTVTTATFCDLAFYESIIFCTLLFLSSSPSRKTLPRCLVITDRSRPKSLAIWFWLNQTVSGAEIGDVLQRKWTGNRGRSSDYKFTLVNESVTIFFCRLSTTVNC